MENKEVRDLIFVTLRGEEPEIAKDVLRMGNIYYVFSWLNKNRTLLTFFPDGEMKTVLIPLPASKFGEFEAFLASEDLCPRISGARPFRFERLPDARIVYFNHSNGNSTIVGEAAFPVVRVNLFLKHLKSFIELSVGRGFIGAEGCKANKEYRAIVSDVTETRDAWAFPGVPERGFDCFMLFFSGIPSISDSHA